MSTLKVWDSLLMLLDCYSYSSTSWRRFLPARRYASAGYRDRNVSVCPSVRPSVTRRYCVKTKKASGMISSPSCSVLGYHVCYWLLVLIAIDNVTFTVRMTLVWHAMCFFVCAIHYISWDRVFIYLFIRSLYPEFKGNNNSEQTVGLDSKAMRYALICL